MSLPVTAGPFGETVSFGTDLRLRVVAFRSREKERTESYTNLLRAVSHVWLVGRRAMCAALGRPTLGTTRRAKVCSD